MPQKTDEFASLDGQIEIAQCLDDAVAAPEAFRNVADLDHIAPSEDHLIHAAAERDDVEQVRDLLNGDSTLLNRRDAGGRTPLHRAVKGSAHEVIALLLDRGADIDATQRHATTPGERGGAGSQRPFPRLDNARDHSVA